MRCSTSQRSLLAAALWCGLGCAHAADAEPEDIAPPAVAAPTRSEPFEFNAQQPLGERYALHDVQWRRQGETSQWVARVSLGPQAPSRALNGEVQWLYRGLDSHTLTLGAQAQHDLQPPGMADSELRFGSYVNNEWQPVPGWRVLFGVRADRLLGGGQALAPRAALLWDVLPSLNLRLLDGVGYREPAASLSPLRELAPQLNPTLGNERLRATELAMDWQAASSLRLAASLHRNDVSEPGSGALAAAAAPGPLQFQNLGRANGNGVEIGGDFAADAGWQLRASWAAARAHDAAASPAPRTLAKLQASSALPWRDTRAGFEWWRMGSHAGATDAQLLFNATMNWQPTGSPWSFAASAHNLTDRRAAEGADALQDALMRDGRRWQLQLERSY